MVLPGVRFEDGWTVAGVFGVGDAKRRLATTTVEGAETCPAPEAVAVFVIFAAATSAAVVV
jgi:hypothetical protein